MFDAYGDQSLDFQMPCRKTKPKDKKRERDLLTECKSVIQDQCEEISQLAADIKRKDLIIQELIAQKELNKSKAFESEQDLSQANRKLMSLEMDLKASLSECSKKDMIIADRQKKAESLERQNEVSQNSISKMQTVSQNNLHVINGLKLKVQTLEETIQLISHENNHLDSAIRFNQEKAGWELSELRKFNQSLKKRFQIYAFESEDQSYTHPSLGSPIPQRHRNRKERAYSTDKKHCRKTNNISPRDTFENLRPTNQPYKNNNTRHQSGSLSSAHFISQFTPNPEMSRQLQSIKNQISSEYSKMEIKKTNYKKERTLRVLEELERKASRLISEAEQSDSESYLE